MLIRLLVRTKDMEPRARAMDLVKPRRHSNERRPRILPLRWLEAMQPLEGTQAIQRCLRKRMSADQKEEAILDVCECSSMTSCRSVSGRFTLRTWLLVLLIAI